MTCGLTRAGSGEAGDVNLLPEPFLACEDGGLGGVSS